MYPIVYAKKLLYWRAIILSIEKKIALEYCRGLTLAWPSGGQIEILVEVGIYSRISFPRKSRGQILSP
jgi:hypothetical protein